jgi:hypothetical protein
MSSGASEGPSAEPAAAAEGPLFERSYDDGEVSFTFTVDARHDVEIVVKGRGNMAGAVAMLAVLDEAVARFGAEREACLFFDVSRVRGAPLRSQFMFGKWLFRHRKAVRRAVVFGAAPWERRLATFACRLGGFHAFRFFDAHAELAARAWLIAG